VNIPPERGKVGDLIDIILDDCYGLEQLQKKTSNPNLKILDVGANVGLFSLAARLNFPQAVILSLRVHNIRGGDRFNLYYCFIQVYHVIQSAKRSFTAFLIACTWQPVT